MAFLGLYNVIGPKLPVLELQARWIAHLFAERVAMPMPDDLQRGVGESRARRHLGVQPVMHELALAFARRAGVEPDRERWPQLARALLFGPLSPAAFRLEGPAALPDAPAQMLDDAAAFGAILSPAFTPEEAAQLAVLRGAGAEASRASVPPAVVAA
jgi:hypothetical protein